eukprot:COSAG01_NODE_2677_length_7264_cov_2.780321_7_plen_736_part_00
MSWRDAVTFCSSGRYSGLASIHSYKEQRDAHDACLNAPLANGTTNKGNPHACWIGLNDDNLLGQHEGQFAWQDGTDVDYVNWYPGEPNDWGNPQTASTSGSSHGKGKGSAAGVGISESTGGEDYVALTFGTHRGGSWNDNPNNGACTHHKGRPCGNYPICQVAGATREPPTAGALKVWQTKRDVTIGNFVAIAKQMSLFGAQRECTRAGYAGLASIHNRRDIINANKACKQLAATDPGGGMPHGCWIGLSDHLVENNFVWFDGTKTDYMNWGEGEPNAGHWKEDGVAMSYEFQNKLTGAWSSRNTTHNGRRVGGAWMDAHTEGQAGHAALQEAMKSGTALRQRDCWGCYGNYGMYPLCQKRRPKCSVAADGRTGRNGPWKYTTMRKTRHGRFIALHRAMSWSEGQHYCSKHYKGLASIHSAGESRNAIQACRLLNFGHGEPSGCWIGLHDSVNFGAQPNQFMWIDGTPVNYVNFLPNEPNNWGQDTAVGRGSISGEDSVSMSIRNGRSGGWNDDHNQGQVGHAGAATAGHDTSCFGCKGVYGKYPICATAAANPKTWSKSHYMRAGLTVKNFWTPSPKLRPTILGRFTVWPRPMSWEDAKKWCKGDPTGKDVTRQPGSLASIHSAQDQVNAAMACMKFAGQVDGLPSGCWIGLGDSTDEGRFSWTDNSPVDYVNWQQNEPTNWMGRPVSASRLTNEGEDAVAIEFRKTWAGEQLGLHICCYACLRAAHVSVERWG